MAIFKSDNNLDILEGRLSTVESIVRRLRDAGLDLGTQASLLGLTTKTLQRWEEANNIPPHPRALLSAFEKSLAHNPELGVTIPQEIAARGIVHALYTMLVAAHPSTVDSQP